MAQPGALVPFLDVGIGPGHRRPGRRFDAVDEIPLVYRVLHPLAVGVTRVGGLNALLDAPALPAQDQGTVLTVNLRAGAGALGPDPVLPGDGARRELEGGRHGVGRLLIVVVEE